MPDLLAVLEAARKPLPFHTPAGDVVSISDGAIYLNCRPLNRVDALDLSAALARAVHETAHTDHTAPKEADHG